MAVDIGPRIFDLLSALPELNLRWMVLLGPRVKVMARKCMESNYEECGY